MLRNIHLYGDLAEKFGKKHRLDVASIGEALHALEANFKGFLKSIKRDGHYEVVRGETLNDEHLGEKQLTMQYKKGDFHLSPVVEGSKSGGIMGIVMTIIGIVLIVVGIYVPAFAHILIPMGISLILGGVGMMMTPTPSMSDYSQREKPEARHSFYFSGPTNCMEQGGSMPLVYGRMTIGATVVSAGIQVESVKIT